MAWLSKCVSCKKEERRLRKDECGHFICARCLEEGCLVCGRVKPVLHEGER